MPVTEPSDIATREDIEKLVDGFYAQALKDPVIGFLFTEVAQIDLPTHLRVVSRAQVLRKAEQDDVLQAHAGYLRES